MEITFLKRPLIEVQLSFEDESIDTDDLTSWLADKATFVHESDDEYMLWIPTAGTSQNRYIEENYGENIPEIILQILKEAIKLQQEKPDQGYPLIVFV